MNKMKCKICGKRTHYDESYGYDSFIVCPKCFEHLHEKYGIVKTMNLIFALGEVAEKREKE